MLVVLAGVAISAVAGLQGGALVGALALLVMVVGALALAR
jgi:hypothetical protein